VDVFFVLSGFLITALLVREHDGPGISLARFYGRRALRIWPVLYVYLLVVVLWAVVLADPLRRAATLRSAPWVATFAANITDAQSHQVFYPFSQTWSLGVEEQFYIVWPCLLILILKYAGTRRRAGAVTLALAAVSAVVQIVLVTHGFHHERVFNGTDMRAQELLIGAAAGMVFTWRAPEISPRVGALLMAVWIVTLVVISRRYSSATKAFYPLQTIVAVTSAGVLLAAATKNSSRLLEATLGNPVMSWLGRISYSIYLWHIPVVLIASDWYVAGDRSRTIGLLAFTLVATVALAAVSYYVIERPFLKLKDRRLEQVVLQ
jgi:peptidoglycan/LPS O-acetylase OafA/YrhL